MEYDILHNCTMVEITFKERQEVFSWRIHAHLTLVWILITADVSERHLVIQDLIEFKTRQHNVLFTRRLSNLDSACVQEGKVFLVLTAFAKNLWHSTRKAVTNCRLYHSMCLVIAIIEH